MDILAFIIAFIAMFLLVLVYLKVERLQKELSDNKKEQNAIWTAYEEAISEIDQKPELDKINDRL